MLGHEQQWETSRHYERLEKILATIEIPFTLIKVLDLALGALILGSQVCNRPRSSTRVGFGPSFNSSLT